MVKINGINLDADGKTLSEYLQTTDYQLSRIAVEINLEIVPKEKFDTIVLHNGDEVEIVSFMGGG